MLPILAGVFVIVYTLFNLFQSHELYFLTTNKERIRFENATGQYEVDKKVAYFNNEAIPVPADTTALATNYVLGEQSPSNKRIEIDLTNQRLYAFEGATKVYDFLVSTGKWGATPTGTFTIWIKLRYTRITGGNKALGTYYDLPNVPYTMFFYNDQIPKWRGFGIHGTYWHSNFGHPMSHGCINMRIEEVEKLFYWAHPELKGKQSIQASADNPGTPVIIYGTAPNT